MSTFLKLTTEVSMTPSDWKIDHQTQVLTVGSCFAEVLGGQLAENKYSVMSNPFGTMFNPYSIAKVLTMALENTRPNEELYTQNADGIWRHYDFHSSFWAKSKQELSEILADALTRVRTFLDSAEVLVITFGTAYVYRYRKNLSLVANCHKTTQSEFVKELLGYEQLQNAWGDLIRTLRTTRKIILTVSPVRHTRDTLPLNQVSKSVLRLLCHRLTEQYKSVSYFPSYEIMLDELRDYRFYKDDLIHPSVLAEQVIFQKFSESYLSEEARETMQEWQGIHKMLAHRPFQPQAPSYRKHLETTLNKLKDLADKLPVEKEIREVKAKLQTLPNQ
ncbi:GSCFA domain-containing protein [Persicitalea sp.]|uniref:GSCFA domain-containing protein n=1 Tax=Persicitalea sp. TaxID=3100273 RepID=UPI003594436F